MLNENSQNKIIPLELYVTTKIYRSQNGNAFCAWGYCIVENGQFLRGHFENIPNVSEEYVELVGLIEGLRATESFTKDKQNLQVKTTSRICSLAINRNWLWQWRHHGWITNLGTEVKNQDLWWEVVPYFDRYGSSIEYFGDKKAKNDPYFVALQEKVNECAKKLKKNWGRKEDN